MLCVIYDSVCTDLLHVWHSRDPKDARPGSQGMTSQCYNVESPFVAAPEERSLHIVAS